VKVGDLVKFVDFGEWKVGVILQTWRTRKRGVVSMDILTSDRIVPRLPSAVEVISENR
jgi:hypothetical protein